MGQLPVRCFRRPEAGDDPGRLEGGKVGRDEALESSLDF